MSFQIKPNNIYYLGHWSSQIISAYNKIYDPDKADIKTGAYLNIKEPCGNNVLLIPVGKIPENKIRKYSDLSQEKTGRALLMNESKSHLLSSQSINEDKNQFAGSVIAPNGFAYGLSGLSGNGDEAAIFMLLIFFQQITTHEQIKKYRQAGFNPLLFKLHQRCLKDIPRYHMYYLEHLRKYLFKHYKA